MGCSSSHSSHIKIQRNYDDVRFTDQKNSEEGRGVPDGQEKYVDVRVVNQEELVRKYRQCQVTQSTYVSESTTSLEQSLT